MPINANAILKRLQDQTICDRSYLEASFTTHGEAARAANESDEAAAHPIMDKFITDIGSEGIRKLTNFTVTEFETLWSFVDTAMQSALMEVRGRRSPTSPKDAIFIALTVLKHFSSWEKHAADYGFKAPTFEKLIMRVLSSLVPDLGEQAALHRGSWACLVDMGYIGISHSLRGIHPKRRPAHGSLDASELERNANVSSDWVIVENFFGRVCSVWRVSCATYTWSERNYSAIQRVTFALTNFHLSLLSLRHDDEDFYGRVLARYQRMANEKKRKRQETQRRYRLNRQEHAAMDAVRVMRL
ncbi:hypothetical protein DYB31_012832 [Aphanomyces astaci]|uniref:DDE Tnp4 domain-containing protein n=1 Tax=Aphanomyces astaci TaxID=112090 RepID=A0A397EE98_APHAT|nr:hypothetical protein DYB31_012832 [Aphanomyces astaci]